jgi:hypothetical protein
MMATQHGSAGLAFGASNVSDFDPLAGTAEKKLAAMKGKKKRKKIPAEGKKPRP